MPNFTVWVEPLRSGRFRVRSEDKYGHRKNWYTVDAHEKSLANKLRDKVLERYFKQELGEIDPTLQIEPLVEEFLKKRRVNEFSDNTLNHNYASLYGFLKETGCRTLEDLTTEKIEAWKDAMTEADWTNKTIRGRLGDLRTFLNWLIQTKRLTISPFGKGMMPRKVKKEPKFYTAAQFMALDNALAQMSYPARLLCNLAHSAGLRKDEALQAQWEDISWHDKGADILLRCETVKGNKPRIPIPLDPSLIALLGSRKSGPLITITRAQVDHVFAAARTKAGLDKEFTETHKGRKYLFDIHGLRHTFAKNYLQSQKGNLGALADLMGHEDIETTRIYARFEKSYFREGIYQAYENRLRAENIAGSLRGDSIQNLDELRSDTNDHEHPNDSGNCLKSDAI